MIGAFFDRLGLALSNKGVLSNQWNIDNLAEHLLRLSQKPPLAVPPPWESPSSSDPLDAYDANTLIHHMLKRGYAVSKVQEKC